MYIYVAALKFKNKIGIYSSSFYLPYYTFPIECVSCVSFFVFHSDNMHQRRSNAIIQISGMYLLYALTSARNTTAHLFFIIIYPPPNLETMFYDMAYRKFSPAQEIA